MSPIANRRPSRMGVSAYDHRPQQQQRASAVMAAHIPELAAYPEAAKPPLMTFMSRARILAASNGSLKSTDTLASSSHHMEPFYCDPMTRGIEAPPSFADRREDVAPVHHVPTPVMASKFKSHEPIYASLSETLSSCHTLDSLGRDRLRGEQEAREEVEVEEVEEEEDEGSATESAGDDFEFHNIRTSRQTLITTTANSPPEAVFGLEDLRPRSRVARSATYRVLCNGLDVKCASKHDNDDAVAKRGESTAAAVAATSESRHGIVTCVTIRVMYSYSSCQTHRERISYNGIGFPASDWR